jgi:hypothetical protein
MRWWDGAQWTGYTTPRIPWFSPDALEKEQRMSVWAQRALAGWGVFTVLQVALMVYLGRTFHHLFSHLGTTSTANSFPRTGPDSQIFSLVLDVGEVALLGLGVVFLVWQYSAATTARALGYPARTSPGFGVGSWFIPIINLWYPYMALSDCLPPDHPLRPRALWAWLGYAGVAFLVFLAFVASLFSVALAIVPLVLALATAALVVKFGTELVRATVEDHRLRIAALGTGSWPSRPT